MDAVPQQRRLCLEISGLLLPGLVIVLGVGIRLSTRLFREHLDEIIQGDRGENYLNGDHKYQCGCIHVHKCLGSLSGLFQCRWFTMCPPVFVLCTL